MLKDDELLGRVEADFRTAGLSDKRLAMLTYAEKLTRVPWDMVVADVVALRETGFSETDILHIAEVVSYYAYVNRIADGLGVELEHWIPED